MSELRILRIVLFGARPQRTGKAPRAPRHFGAPPGGAPRVGGPPRGAAGGAARQHVQHACGQARLLEDTGDGDT
ncbi:hypothetical protein, partial [Streptomyces europaeiscabiei]|uniref:hypothetical protein n=1 Tax=Streptomyces europaeiscabiei TaxID=146819 RepID=UPI0038F748FF